MRLVRLDESGGLSLVGPLYNDIPSYAILSHRWRDGEVIFEDLTKDTAKDKPGYAKLQFCADQARCNGLSYFWIDTCCINKESAAELSEAIISMFRWYEKAAVCYVYLDDVPRSADDVEAAFAQSEWFERGWTLQELLAPASVQFFSKEGELLGDKKSLEKPIHNATGIDLLALRGRAVTSFTIGERMRWAATRKTTREEDQAYSLLGIFDISMPALYGEGREKAMARLEREISRPPPGFSPSPVPAQRRQLLGSLKFEAANYRRNDISEAHSTTFEWIFRDNQKWSNFQTWLENEEGIYWIHGKPGSGKSTLMKYILENPLTFTHLRTWSSRDPIIMPFFLWNSGNPMQRSLKGLLCSLLRELCSQHEPTLQALLVQPFIQEKDSVTDWSKAELKTVLFKSLQAISCPVFILLDGLDELDRQEEVSNLTTLVKSLPRRKLVKLCVSSRPEPELVLEFSMYPQLRLQDLTASDIRRFVKDTLKSIPTSSFQVQEKDSIISRASDTVIKKADGVFLWAHLALRSIKLGIIQEEDWFELEGRLQVLPSELRNLYSCMWGSLNENNPLYRAEAAKYFQYMLYSPTFTRYSSLWTMSILDFTLATDEPLLEKLLREKSKIDDEALVQSCHKIEKRVKYRSAGLLEIHHREGRTLESSEKLHSGENYTSQSGSLSTLGRCARSEIAFIHRSAYDYLREPETLRNILSHYSEPEEDITLKICKARVALASTSALPDLLDQLGLLMTYFFQFLVECFVSLRAGEDTTCELLQSTKMAWEDAIKTSGKFKSLREAICDGDREGAVDFEGIVAMNGYEPFIRRLANKSKRELAPRYLDYLLLCALNRLHYLSPPQPLSVYLQRAGATLHSSGYIIQHIYDAKVSLPTTPFRVMLDMISRYFPLSPRQREEYPIVANVCQQLHVLMEITLSCAGRKEFLRAFVYKWYDAFSPCGTFEYFRWDRRIQFVLDKTPRRDFIVLEQIDHVRAMRFCIDSFVQAQKGCVCNGERHAEVSEQLEALYSQLQRDFTDRQMRIVFAWTLGDGHTGFDMQLKVWVPVDQETSSLLSTCLYTYAQETRKDKDFEATEKACWQIEQLKPKMEQRKLKDVMVEEGVWQRIGFMPDVIQPFEDSS